MDFSCLPMASSVQSAFRRQAKLQDTLPNSEMDIMPPWTVWARHNLLVVDHCFVWHLPASAGMAKQLRPFCYSDYVTWLHDSMPWASKQSISLYAGPFPAPGSSRLEEGPDPTARKLSSPTRRQQGCLNSHYLPFTVYSDVKHLVLSCATDSFLRRKKALSRRETKKRCRAPESKRSPFSEISELGFRVIRWR